VDRSGVMRWVSDYERAWRDGDAGAVERLFTPDVVYRRSPYHPPDAGHDAVKAFWRVDAGSTFTVAAEPVAVEADRAVVRLEVRYLAPDEQEYRDLWVLRFAPDGRVAEFEEWPYWPERPFTAQSG
jgi:ketosteroid isomerase-like protein